MSELRLVKTFVSYAFEMPKEQFMALRDCGAVSEISAAVADTGGDYVDFVEWDAPRDSDEAFLYFRVVAEADTEELKDRLHRAVSEILDARLSNSANPAP